VSYSVYYIHNYTNTDYPNLSVSAEPPMAYKVILRQLCGCPIVDPICFDLTYFVRNVPFGEDNYFVRFVRNVPFVGVWGCIAGAWEREKPLRPFKVVGAWVVPGAFALT
jgi:hypothetical protein